MTEGPTAAGPVMALLPRFTQPGRLRDDPPMEPRAPATPASPAPVEAPDLPRAAPAAGELPEPLPPMTEYGATRTGTSSRTERADPKVAAELAAVVVVLVVAGFALLVRLRTGGERTLRRPTDHQRARIAAPLGRIAARHVPAEALTNDVVDLVAAGAATGEYLDDGPLLVTAPVDPGAMPDPALQGAEYT